MDMYKMLDEIQDQTEKIADKGLTTANIDSAYKLIEMWYRLKKIELMGGNYSQRYNDSGNSYNDSYGRHYVRGHYSRDNDHYSRYMDSKRDFRNNHSTDCKAKMMDTLEMYMDDFAKQMEDLARDADCKEEREVINRYIDKIKRF